MMERSEYAEQVAVFHWASLNEYRWPCLKLLFGSIMGVKLHPKTLNKMRKAGMKKGKPDINLPVPRGGFCGLWIELKRSDGAKPSPDQVEMLKLLAAEGNAAYAIFGSAGAIRIITRYVKGEIIKNGTTKK